MSANLPKAYKNGYQDFYGRIFLVNKNVLIPRPETEFIIDLVLKLSGKPYLPGIKPTPRVLPENPCILDVGTGSGCIAITIKLELKEAEVSASDVSPAALEIARENAKNLKAKINFIESNLLGNVDFKPDLIVANLPYVDRNWDWLDRDTLSFEPELALYAEDEGLKIIKQLLKEAGARKVKHLILESDPSEQPKIAQFAKKMGFALVETHGFATYYQFLS